MEIKLTEKQVKDLVDVLDDELTWMVCDSGEADSCEKPINVFIMLLRSLGYEVMANDYEGWFKEFMENL